MRSIAQETGGALAGVTTVNAGGVKSHQFDVKVDGHVDEYTFVLIAASASFSCCAARKSSSDAAFCSTLLTSFRPA